MNKFIFLLPFFFLACLTLPKHSQAQTGGVLVSTPGDGVQNGTIEDVLSSDLPYVDNQLIFRYDVAPDPGQRVQITSDLKDDGTIVVDWSPSGKFMLAYHNLDGDICEYTTNGNPDASNDNQGDQIGLNYYTNNQFWFENGGLVLPCLDEDDPDSHIPFNYTPTFDCSNDQTLIPSTGSNTVRVAILDSGLRGEGATGYRHGVAYNQVLIPENIKFLYDDNGPITGEEEILAQSGSFNPHGAYIFDLIGAWFRSEGMESQLSITAYQVLNEELRGNLFQLIKAIELATYAKVNKPHIISLSLGFTPLNCNPIVPGPEPQHIPTLLNAALKDAEDKDIIVITSAGNSGRDINVRPQFPAAETGLNNLITVGALNCGDNTRAPFSNYSPQHVDLFAPGASVKVLNDFNCYVEVSGTSFSCPIVAAKAAFHVTTQNTYDDEEVLCLLRSQVDPYPLAEYGIVNSSVNNFYCDVKPAEKRSYNEPLPAAATAFPNPFIDQLTVSTLNASKENETIIRLLDGQGREVVRQTANNSSTILDLQDLKRGVYWLHITSTSGTETRPVVKH